MTFEAFEESTEGSQPIEIYKFTLGAQIFKYTSAEDTITIGADIYLPIAISRGNLKQGPEERDTVLEIEVPTDNAFAGLYLSIVPGDRAKCVVQRVQRPDFPGPEVVTIFTGFVQGVRYTNQGKTATIAAVPTISVTSRSIPRFTYLSLCNHVLYDTGCKVDETDPTFLLDNALVTAVSGNTITVAGVAAKGASDFFVSGFVSAFGGSDHRPVLAQSGDVLTLLLPFPSDITGTTVDVLAGCDHTIAVCDSKFFTSEDLTSNVINFGGFAFVPTRNPFETGLV